MNRCLRPSSSQPGHLGRDSLQKYGSVSYRSIEELQELKNSHPQAKVVTYVNSSVEIKALSDVCCTSSNALNVVKNINSNQIIFIPDKNLGAYVQKMVPEKQVILFEGYCYVHNRIKPQEIIQMKTHYPNTKVIVHPEVPMGVIELADEVLSTSGMLKYVRQSPEKTFIVATEQGLLNRMKRENPEKTFYPPVSAKICVNMKRTSLLDIYLALKNEQYSIEIDPEIAKKAVNALNSMLKFN